MDVMGSKAAKRSSALHPWDLAHSTFQYSTAMKSQPHFSTLLKIRIPHNGFPSGVDVIVHAGEA